MNFNDMLKSQKINPEDVIVFRHRPTEPELRKKLPWLAINRPELFNAYQQTQGRINTENSLKRLVGKGYVASFIGHKSGQAIFVALYKITSSKSLSPKDYQEDRLFQELRDLGGKLWFTDEFSESERPTLEWFNLQPTNFYSHWKGKLIVNWPPPELSWWRRAHNNDFSIHSVQEECALDGEMPAWDCINLTWDELKILPSSWKQRISQWRGIYYIFDISDGKSYVGSAYGEDNLMGRWENYGVTGHGGNKLLRERNPSNFRFSILERVSPDLKQPEVSKIEKNWKDRLHTHAPFGLNSN